LIDIEGRRECEETCHDNDYDESKANDKFAHCVLPGKPGGCLGNLGVASKTSRAAVMPLSLPMKRSRMTALP
jgi:hypothetical protein